MCVKCFEAGEAFEPGGYDRWANGVLGPAEQKGSRGAADTTLARAHAAAGLKFCCAPVGVTLECGERHILAAADDGFRDGKQLELIPKGEAMLQGARKTPCSGPARKK